MWYNVNPRKYSGIRVNCCCTWSYDINENKIVSRSQNSNHLTGARRLLSESKPGNQRIYKVVGFSYFLLY